MTIALNKDQRNDRSDWVITLIQIKDQKNIIAKSIFRPRGHRPPIPKGRSN